MELPAVYEALRRGEPAARVCFPSGRPVWVVTTHENVRSVLADPAVSSEQSHPAYPTIFPINQRREGEARPKLSYAGMDRPEHSLHRRLVAGEFTEKSIEKLRGRVRHIAQEYVSALLDGPQPADLVRAVAVPVPAAVTCGLLGIPDADRDRAGALSRLVLSRQHRPEIVHAASMQFTRYLHRLILAKESEPEDDLLSRLILRYRETDLYDHAQMVHIAAALLTAGLETTSNMIALGVVALLSHPGQFAALVADSGRLGPAVDELLRYLSIADLAMARVSAGPVRVGPVTIAPGEGIMALGGAANHDPAVFDHPDRLDIHRDAGRHLAFGYGIHQCLGQHLARLELETVFSELLARAPGLRLAVPAEALQETPGTVFHGVAEVPVTW